MKFPPRFLSLALPAAILVFAGAALSARAQNPETPHPTTAHEAQDAVESTDIPAYPDSVPGLVSLMDEMLKVGKSSNLKDLEVYAKSLVLPEGDAWLRSTFGETIGGQIAQATAAARASTESEVIAKIVEMRKEKLNDANATQFTDSCNFDATPDEYPILLLRQNQETFYDVRFNSTKGESIWGFFVYVDGAFRYLPMVTRLAMQAAAAPGAPGQPVPVDPEAQAAKLISRVAPVYPAGARFHNAQGNVVLSAVITPDGMVREVTLLQGVCRLSEAAMRAVRRWRYAPTLVNGQPVEVQTTITVIFSLGD